MFVKISSFPLWPSIIVAPETHLFLRNMPKPTFKVPNDHVLVHFFLARYLSSRMYCGYTRGEESRSGSVDEK